MVPNRTLAKRQGINSKTCPHLGCREYVVRLLGLGLFGPPYDYRVYRCSVFRSSAISKETNVCNKETHPTVSPYVKQIYSMLTTGASFSGGKATLDPTK